MHAKQATPVRLLHRPRLLAGRVRLREQLDRRGRNRVADGRRRNHRRRHLLGPVRRGDRAHLLDRHRARPVGRDPGRVQRHRDAAGRRQRLRRETSGRVSHGVRDGVRRHPQAARAVVVGADRDVRRHQPKMQFDISFAERDESARFHGIGKLVFDMPRSDWTFMHDRLAHGWFRQVGIAAGCAANARVEINGAYYGLFVAKETTSRRVIAEFFPQHPTAICGRRRSSRRPTTRRPTGAARWPSCRPGTSPPSRRSSTWIPR